MRRIGLAVILTLSFFATSVVGDAQQPSTPMRIGVLTAQSPGDKHRLLGGLPPGTP
jgi:hypothetical protein